MTVASAIGARETLRASTREDHERVDSLPRMQRLMDPEVSAEDYAEVIRRLYSLHEHLCDRVGAALGSEGRTELCVRDLMTGLEQDVRSLGFAGRVPDAAPPAPAPALATAAHALGAWYVLEGAALGGVLIARHLRQHLGEDLPLAHFARAGDGRWLRFLKHLEISLDNPAKLDAAVDGARLAYRFTEQMLGDE